MLFLSPDPIDLIPFSSFIYVCGKHGCCFRAATAARTRRAAVDMPIRESSFFFGWIWADSG